MAASHCRGHEATFSQLEIEVAWIDLQLRPDSAADVLESRPLPGQRERLVHELERLTLRADNGSGILIGHSHRSISCRGRSAVSAFVDTSQHWLEDLFRGIANP
jgi:hypothetical protein